MKITFSILFIFMLGLIRLNGQTSQIITIETYSSYCPSKPLDTLVDSKKIFVNGYVYGLPKGIDSFIPYANVVVKGTKIYSRADSLGYYSLDITAIADTISKIIFYCAYPGYQTKEISFKRKITKTVKLDFELNQRPSCELPDIGDGKKR